MAREAGIELIPIARQVVADMTTLAHPALLSSLKAI